MDNSHCQTTGAGVDNSSEKTNKTPAGAKRQSIITSVLRTLSKQLSAFTLASVIAEIRQWADTGRGRFQTQADAAGLSRPPPIPGQSSLLDRLIINVDLPQPA